jgi:DNA-binding response OmpR family regulator
VELTATEFSLLESLLRRRGERVCSRAELLREVWRNPGGMGTNIVEVYINYLRRKLGRRLGPKLGGGAMRANCQSVIRTVRGEGYVLGEAGDPALRAQWNRTGHALAGLRITAEGCVVDA